MASQSTRAAFGKKLRRWRLAHGLSQRAFGALLRPKARHSTVSCWESGFRRPSLRFLGQIVALTGIPAEVALGLHRTRRIAARP